MVEAAHILGSAAFCITVRRCAAGGWLGFLANGRGFRLPGKINSMRRVHQFLSIHPASLTLTVFGKLHDREIPLMERQPVYQGFR